MKKSLQEIATELGKLVEEKNKAYGNSFAVCGDFLKILYPMGVKPEDYTKMLLLVRIFDKQIRIATNSDSFNEDAWKDISGYGLLGTYNNQDSK